MILRRLFKIRLSGKSELIDYLFKSKILRNFCFFDGYLEMAEIRKAG